MSPAGWLAVLAVAAAATSCSGDDDEGLDGTEPPTVVVAPPTTERTRVADGTLRVGLLVPESGDGAAIGESLTEAVMMATDRINSSGGLRGRPVEVFGEDEGTTAAAAGEAIEALFAADVDAVIGPTSSVVALGALGDLLGGGVLACSPTATALALEDYPSSDLFFRTAPSDTLQAEALAQLAEQTGARSAAVAFLDDTYGRPLAEATIQALGARDLAVEVQVPFVATDSDLSAEAAQLAEGEIGVMVIIGNADHGTRLLAAIGATITADGGDEVPDILVNGAMRRPSSPQLVQSLPATVRERVRGVSPAATAVQPEEPAGLFATNAYDCMNLIALSAVQAESDAANAMAAELVEVSRSGVACADFAACLDLLTRNRNIDYDGPGGTLEIGAQGDPEQARFEVFEFDDAGVDVGARSILVSG